MDVLFEEGTWLLSEWRIVDKPVSTTFAQRVEFKKPLLSR